MYLSVQQYQDQMPGKSLSQKMGSNDLEKKKNTADKDELWCVKEFWPLKYKQNEKKQIRD